MCLGIPGKIIKIDSSNELFSIGHVDFGGLTKPISLCFTPEAVVGDYVLVHVGFAMSIVDQQRAEELIHILDASYSLVNDKNTQ